jgi:hypothetical protein
MFCSSKSDRPIMKTSTKSEAIEPARPVTEFEWRFTSCPEDQRHWCDIYEYARSNSTVVEMVARYRSAGVWDDPGLFPDRCSNLLGKMFFDAFPEFPVRPFLSLPAASRTARCSSLNKLRGELALRIHKPGGGYTNSQATWSLEIHPSASRESILRMLDRSHAEHRGGQHPIDRLKFLSVYRLIKIVGKAKDVPNFIATQRAALAVKDETAVARDKRKAEDLVKGVLKRIL